MKIAIGLVVLMLAIGFYALMGSARVSSDDVKAQAQRDCLNARFDPRLCDKWFE